MSTTPPTKTNTPEGLPVDDAAQMSAWQRSTGRKPNSTENPSRPVRGKVTHGIFANRIFGAEEAVQFAVMIESFREETCYNGSGDLVSLELLCIYCLKITRAVMAEQWDGVERLDRMIRMHLSDLKLTRKMREGDGPVDGTPNPLDFAMDLVEKARQRLAERAEEEAIAAVVSGNDTAAHETVMPRDAADEKEGDAHE
jgi:hypothetical protein